MLHFTAGQFEFIISGIHGSDCHIGSYRDIRSGACQLSCDLAGSQRRSRCCHCAGQFSARQSEIICCDSAVHARGSVNHNCSGRARQRSGDRAVIQRCLCRYAHFAVGHRQRSGSIQRKIIRFDAGCSIHCNRPIHHHGSGGEIPAYRSRGQRRTSRGHIACHFAAGQSEFIGPRNYRFYRNTEPNFHSSRPGQRQHAIYRALRQCRNVGRHIAFQRSVGIQSECTSGNASRTFHFRASINRHGSRFQIAVYRSQGQRRTSRSHIAGHFAAAQSKFITGGIHRRHRHAASYRDRCSRALQRSVYLSRGQRRCRRYAHISSQFTGGIQRERAGCDGRH